ncbi:MAG: GNAT family N-acetyltransferase [Sneathiella sp.]|nr:GNAT family N-acetyltransferase [Sneathiella sp.]
MTEPLKVISPRFLPGFLPPVYRELAPKEQDALLLHLLRLGPLSRHMRFGYPAGDGTIERYCNNRHGRAPVLCGAFIGGELRGVAELRFISEKWPYSAEIALSVEDEWQDMGIGTELMSRALRAARLHHISVLEVNCLPENTRMRRIADKYGAAFSHQTGLIKGVFEPLGPGYALSAASTRQQ